MEWYNDCEYKCDDCEVTFKAYCTEDVRDVSFCPYCASRNIEPIDEREE